MESRSAVTWQSLKWPNGARYDGLVRDNKCDGRGVFHFSNGDRYEGDFRSDLMDGKGTYIWQDGTIQGCGVTISRKNDGGFAVQEGQFVEDSFFGPMLSCYEVEARNSAKEADAAAAKARGYVRQVSQDSRSSWWANLFHSSHAKE